MTVVEYMLAIIAIVLRLLFTVFEELSGYEILRMVGAEGRT